MSVAGYLTYVADVDKTGFSRGLSSLESGVQSSGTKIKNIVAALGIDKIISKTMSTITSCIDSAISRYDTLNNFSVVLSNLGYSSEEADEALEKLTNSIDGLPTSLDSIATYEQQFIALIGNVEEATDLTIALNDATLAGGQGQEVANSALDQWYQIIANGKPDEQSWKIIRAAMPAQLNQIAEAIMGANASSDELFSAWQDGTVTTEEVINALVQLDSDGGDSMASFAQQAQDATAGIGTAMSNMKTRITKGLEAIIESTDSALEEAGFVTIAENINNLSSKIKEALVSLSESDVIPTLVNNLGTIVPMIATVVTGFNLLDGHSILKFSDNVGSGVTSILVKLTGLSDNVTSIAGHITSIFSKGLGFAALAGLALVALGLLEDNFGDTINNLLTKATEQGPEIITNLVNGITSKIPDLITKGSELLQQLLDVLIANLPSIIDGGVQIITSLIIGLAQELPSLIPKMLEVILTIVNSLIANLPLILEAGIQLLMGLINGIINCIPTLVAMLHTIISTIVSTLLTMLPQIIEAGVQLLIALINGIINAIPQLIAMLPEIILTIVETLLSQLPQIIDAGINILIALIDGLINAIPQLIAMTPQIISSIVNTLTTHLPKILQMGITCIVKLAAGLIQAIPQLVAKIPQIVTAIIDGIGEVVKKIPEIGVNLIKGLWQGISDTVQWLYNKISGFVSGCLDKIKSFFGINSPSKLMRDEIGKFIPQGVAVGIEADTDTALEAIDDMNDEIMNEMNKAVAYETGSINASASVKSNNSMLNVIQASFNLDGSIEMDGKTVGRTITPYVTKTIKVGGI